jgi:hypothetical protein
MNEIHRVSKVPETLEGFNELVASIFKERLPALWSLQYVDSDGDNIILADSKDFEEFQKFGSSGATGTSVIKVFVKAANGMDVSQMRSDQEEDYQIIGAPQMDNSQKIEEKSIAKSIENSIEIPQVEESVQVEVPKVEESVQAEVPQVQVEEKQEEEDEEDPRVEKEEEEEEEEDPRVEKEDEPMVAQKVEVPIAEVEEKVAVEEQVEEQKKEEELSDILNSSARSIELIGDKKVLVELDILEQLMGSALEKSLPKFIQKTTEELSKKEKEKEKEEVPVNPWAVEKKRIVNKVIHYGVRCNGCYTNPIIGFRYKCTICPDFDYCEECESTKEHPHDFIKMKKHTFNNEKKVSFANPGGILKRREVPKKKREEEEVQLIKGPENDYFKALKEKAEKLQKCFPKVDFELLLAYVNGAPDDMSLEELIENYKH